MVTKPFDWAAGVELPEHSRRKHKVIEEYFTQYLQVRCQIPHQTRFKLAIVDGFAGGGRYKAGEPGSPLIFVEVLERFAAAANIKRSSEGMPSLDIHCRLILNDLSSQALDVLRSNLAPYQARIEGGGVPHLSIEVDYWNRPFEEAYPLIAHQLEADRFPNVLFNLDQAGHQWVSLPTIRDIMVRFRRAEIFYTFMISSLLAFLQKREPVKLRRQLSMLDMPEDVVERLDELASNDRWLGLAERLVYEAFGACAPFVSPFSITNPEGWRYWLIHFANEPRARQVYNDVLHANSSMQGHYGRAGLQMLAFDPSQSDAQLYLFDQRGRDRAQDQLFDDVPRLISGFGDAIEVADFYRQIYNSTPAHSDDIHQAIVGHPDLEVLTALGGKRRKADRINRDDQIILKRQSSFFPMFRDWKRK
ncbi:three-Cys-motif partner protein [Fulvimarina manganoxydans]|uniref:Three-Cys-motif partner protein n=1 Tax=Fulvimarina manganoxydans TaxID=937218 RepID=A0A1W2CVD1_9HYPH|nr:three-Cys-motif partner protein TcmP [Fulvimarina manganoxydans]SMC89169.1 three-Cys-motif partner protein [Fulvimarina manganoxydans]